MESNLKFSPKLKNAMEEIKQILNKHDIAGLIVLHEPGYGEHYIKINPSYSALEFKNREGIIMKGRQRYNSNKIKHNKAIENSLSLLKVLCELAGKTIIPLIEVSQKMDEYYNATHKNEGYLGHDELFN